MSQILSSIRGRRLGIDADDAFLSLGGFRSGIGGNQIVLPSPTTVAIFDDFLGDVVADEWNYVEGSDSSTADGAISEAVNGVFLLTPGDSAGSVAADGAELNSALNWKANQGGLRFHARFKLASIASVSCFIGFTDNKSLEQAIYSAGSADTFTSDATDAVGIMFDTAMATDDWWLTGVKGDTDATAQDTGVAPVADTWETVTIEVSTAGVAQFYRNGNPIGTPMANALTTTVALTPCFFVRPKSAAAGKTMSIDYVNVSANRV